MNSSYQQLVADVDRLTSALSARYARHLECRAGCSGCCHQHISVFRVEAEAIGEAVRSLAPSTLSAIEEQAREALRLESIGQDPSCPLLVADQCTIYGSRPIICRTQGLPLLLKAEDGLYDVDCCPLNFTASDALDELDEKHLVNLDDLNLELAIANLTHSRESGIPDSESGRRFSIAEIILNSENQ